MRNNITIATIVFLTLISARQTEACNLNARPVAAVMGGSSRTTKPYVEITFDGSPSYDDDRVTSWSWHFNDEAPGVTHSGQVVKHQFNATYDTTYTATLTVIDNGDLECLTPYTVTVYVRTNPKVIWHVRQTESSDSYYGTSWASAFHSIEKATSVARPEDEIWVASGTYKPSQQSDARYSRTKTFMGGDGVYIYGGFAGNESSIDERIIASHTTTLSGDLNGNDPGTTSDNAYRVVSFYQPARVDGFTITGGRADGSGHDNGAAFSGKTVFANCSFTNNHAAYGGAVSTWGSPTFVNCVFEDNHATGDGGAVWANGGTVVTLTDCIFRQNVAGLRGGGMYASHVMSTVTNCAFDRNAAARGGGMFANDHSQTTLTNCTFSCNTATADGVWYGAGFRNAEQTGSTIKVANCIFWGNRSPNQGASSVMDMQIYSDPNDMSFRYFNNNCTEGWTVGHFSGSDNIGDSPIFHDPSNGDLRLTGSSPCIDAGTNEVVVCDTDLDGNARIIDYPTVDNGLGCTVDMGAYECINYPPLEVWAGGDRTITSAVHRLDIIGAFVRGGNPAYVDKTWTIVSVHAGCRIEFHSGSSEHDENPSFAISVDPNVFYVLDRFDIILRLAATDSDSACTVQDYARITVVPDESDQSPPSVAVSCSIGVNGKANLTGEVTDDGLPYGLLFYWWDVVQTPVGGKVCFDDVEAPSTSATFSVAGTYLLRLTASDGWDEGSDTVAVKVDQPSALRVSAGGDKPVMLHGAAVTVSFTDSWVRRGVIDVSGPPVSIEWQVIGGSAADVVFDDPARADPNVTVAKTGTYVLQLVAWDASQRISDEVVLSVGTGTDELTVDAGPDMVIGQFETATLRGTIDKTAGTLATDWVQSAGDPWTWIENAVTYANGEGISVKWSVLSGPGGVEFLGFDADGDVEHCPDAATPHVRFAKTGDYVLRLTAQWHGISYMDTVRVTVPPMQVSIGGTHMLALDSSGAVWGRGIRYIAEWKEGYGLPGDSNEYVIAFEKIRDSNDNELGGIEQVAAGCNVSYAIERDSGQVWAFGDNRLSYEGRYLGVGSSADFVEHPSAVLNAGGGPLDQIVKIAVPASDDVSVSLLPHVLALGRDGIVRTWGCNTYGQLGIRSIDNRTYPCVVLTDVNEPNQMLTGIVDIDAGLKHSIALDANGNVWTWGDNERGQLGNDTAHGACIVARKVIYNGSPLSDIVDIATTQSAQAAFFAVDRNGHVWYWGDSLEYGYDATSVTRYPQLVQQPSDANGPLSNIVAVSAGLRHAIALTSDGHVLTWGGPKDGLGIGIGGDVGVEDLLVQEEPAYVHSPDGSADTYLEGIVSISAGNRACAAIDGDGRVWQWGATFQEPYKYGYAFTMGWTPDWGEKSLRVPRETGLGYVTNERRPIRWYDTIQRAVDDAITGDTIVVHPGVYRRFVIPGGKHITVRSTDPDNIDTVSQTVVCGRAYGPYQQCDGWNDVVVTIEPANSSNLEGLTITSGCIGVLTGARADGYTDFLRDYVVPDANDSPRISQCRIVNNTHAGVMCYGLSGSPTIEDNWINGNTDGFPGTAGYAPTYDQNDIEETRDGIYCKSLGTVIRNNTIVDKDGYGVRYEGNEPNSRLAIYNCILWRNHRDPPTGTPQSLNCNQVGCFSRTYSQSVEPVAACDDPCFAALDVNSPTCGNTAFLDDLHLLAGSSCINTGDPYSAHSLYDIDGQPRVAGGRIDIGADEFSGWSVYAGSDRRASRDEWVLFTEAKLRFFSTDMSLGTDKTALWTVIGPNGSSPSLQNHDTLSPSVRFDKYGVYVMKLEIHDSSVTPPSLLSADTVQVTVGPAVSVVASPKRLVLPSQSNPTVGSNLTGTVEGWDPAKYTTEWSSSAPSVAVVTVVSPLIADVNVSEAGVYTITIKVFDKNTNELAGQGATLVVVTRPGIVVEAGDDQEGIATGAAVHLSGSVIGKSDCDVEWHFPDGAIVIGGTNAIQSAVRFTNPGTYDIALAAAYEGRFVGGDILTVEVVEPGDATASPWMSGKPAGDDKQVRFMIDFGATMGKDANLPIFDRVEWKVNGFSIDDRSWGQIQPQGCLKPEAVFQRPGIYSLLMSLYDGDAIVGQDTAVVEVIEPQGVVLAKISEGGWEYDEYSSVLNGTSVRISLVGQCHRITIPGDMEIDYEWSSDAPGIRFDTVNAQNTGATITQSGIYHITLTARISGDTTIIGRDTVTLAVFGDQTICSPGDRYEPALTGPSHGLDLSKAFLWAGGRLWHDGDAGMPSVTWAGSSGVSFNHSDIIQPHVTFNSPGIYTLTMSCNGTSGSVDVVVEDPLLIYSFTATPPTLLSDAAEVTFFATFSTPCTWTIDVIHSSDIVVRTIDSSNSSSTLNMAMTADDLGMKSNGLYYIRLTAMAGDDVDVQYADIVLNRSVVSSGIIARLDNRLKVASDGSGVLTKAKTVIQEGKYNILGKAYLTDITDTRPVEYRIEVVNADGAYWNITPELVAPSQFKTGRIVSPDGCEGSFGEIDLTSLPNGVYKMILAVKFSSLPAAYDEVDFILDCPLKIGNLTFSQEDIAIQVGGYPLRVIRTYDGMRKDTEGDFGYGWTYSLANMDITLNEERNGTCRWGEPYDRDVTITLPDGTRATFASRFEYASSTSGGIYTVRYDSPQGVTATLETVENDKIVNGALGVGYFWQTDNHDFRPMANYSVDLSFHDFSGFKLTTADGTIYNIARMDYGISPVEVGGTELYDVQSYGKPYLSSILLPSGEKVRFDVDLTDPENPRTVGVTRYLPDSNDPAEAMRLAYENGHIVAVYPPSETLIDANGVSLKPGAIPYVKYEYDRGNLDKVLRLKSREGTLEYETIIYKYEETIAEDLQTHEPYLQCKPGEHRITAIRDARGIDVVKYHYDLSGKLVATEDSSGGTIKVVHDTANMREKVQDRMGVWSEYVYDERGRVVEQTRDGHFTTYFYTGTTPTYVENGNTYYGTAIANPFPDKPCAITAPGDSTTYYQYDDAGRVKWTIDPEMNATSNIYDPDTGNLLSSTQWKLKRDGGVIVLVGGKLAFDELTTSRSYYTPNGLVYLSGTTTGPTNALVWHSANLTCYDTSGRVDHTVQLDPTATYFNTSVFDSGSVRPHDDLRNYTLEDPPRWVGCPITAYDYIGSTSIDQPSSVTDASGATTYFHYNANGAQDASWYNWDDPATTVVNYKHIVTVNDLDCQGRSVRTRRITGDDLLTSVPPGYLDGTSGTSIILGRTVYNPIGKVDYSIDQDRNLTKYEYDEVGNVAETRTYNVAAVTDLDDKAAVAAFIDNSANILTVSQTLYDAEGRAIVSVGPYDPAVYLLTDMTKWPVGTETVYDTLGRVERTRRWAAVEITIADVYNPSNQLVGKKTTGWTTQGAAPVANGELSYSRTEYDAAGRVWKAYQQDETGAEHCITEYTYDNAGKQTLVTTLPGQTGETTTETHYDGQQRDKVTDARGNITSFGYDDAGRLIRTEYPEAPYVTGFDTGGSPITTTGPTYTHIGYDGFGRKAWESEQTIESALDSDDLETKARQFRYDSAGRLTMVILPKVLPVGGTTEVHPIYRYYYDQHGNQIAILDPLGRATVFEYDEQNRQKKKYMPYALLAAVTGDLTSPYVFPTIAVILGNMPATPAPAHEEQTYDVFGRIETSTDYKHQFTVYSYDAFGRLDYKRHYATATVYDPYYPSTNADPEIHYTYDNLGRRDSIYINGSAAFSEHYDYTAEGNLSDITYTGIGAVHYEYDPITGQKKRTSADDGTVTDTRSTYDELGRLRTVQGKADTVPPATQAEYTYDAAGSRDSLKYANGNFVQHSYDQLNRLTGITNYQTKPVTNQPTPPVLSSFAYSLAANGRRRYVNETLQYAASPAPTTEQHGIRYDYDNLGRLTDETAAVISGTSGGYTGNYIYDIVGNRKMREVAANMQYLRTIYSYDDATDRLLTESHTDQQAMLGDKTWYAYADGAGGYTSSGPGGTMRHLGTLRAFFLGLPTVWSLWAFVTILALLPVVLVSPAAVEYISRRLGFAPKQPYSLTAFKRGVCVLLAYVMLVGPGVSDVLAQEGTLYSQCQASNWGISDRTIEYTYDGNGSVETKTTRSGNTTLEVVTYTYDLQNHLATATTDHQTGFIEHAQYGYSDSGIRLSSHTWTTQSGGPPQNEQTKLFLIDENNGTGYAQVLEEKQGGISTCSYTIGDDVLGQSKWNAGTSAYVNHCLLYDGHGSTRQLSSSAGTVAETYGYDAYGVMLGTAANAADAAGTKLLYSGEQYDSGLKQYYLRARYYDQSNGRFTQLDPYSGNTSDPQSLHKYTYCHNDPANGIDPSGETYVQVLVASAVIGFMMGAVIGAIRTGTVVGALKAGLIGALTAPLMTMGVTAAGLGIAAAFNLTATAGLAIAFGVTTAGSMAWNTYEYVTAKNEKDKLAAGVSVIFTAGFAVFGAYQFGKIPSLPISARSGTVLPNSKGALGEFLSEAASLLRGERIVARQVTIQTRTGIRVRVDSIVRTLAGNLKILESKSGPASRLSQNQRAGYLDIMQSGGTVRGNNGLAGGLPSDTVLGPTEVQVDAWNGSLAQF